MCLQRVKEMKRAIEERDQAQQKNERGDGRISEQNARTAIERATGKGKNTIISNSLSLKCKV